MSEEITLTPKMVFGGGTEPFDLNGQLVQYYRFQTEDGQLYRVVIPYGYLNVAGQSEAA